MLKSTFQHLKGVGSKSEKALWHKGVSSWEEYVTLQARQPSLFKKPDEKNKLSDSFQAYESGDMAFFAKSLPTSEYYRILLEFPQDVLFLDIETTGLSVYYDIITIVGWSLGKKYGVYLNGGNKSPLINALSKAKALVTFNGIMFDLKFIEKHFDTPQTPPVHLDLRFFTKRIGLTGGQKKIEQQIGFARQHEIEGMLGEAAPILWHRYRRGDLDAMRRLIEYNHADIDGMKYILDYAITKYQKQAKIPKQIRVTPRFKRLKTSIMWGKRPPRNTDSKLIYIPPFTGSTKPLITYSQLDAIKPLEDFCSIGIDLVSSEERETGFCVLRGNIAETCRVKTDDEMIKLAIEAGADLISIDSPLSIPAGRTSFFNDDPFREEFGIMRECERILHRRGVKSYPCLIDSMQKLTQRGMLLAEKFRKIGLPVIESYPGAAQDIMQIPRKQHGENFLTEALAEFGLEGHFVETAVSHDELDAITSAVVGHFFWVGMFEALGTPEEDYLIIPDLNADYKSWLSKKIIGISGQIGSGKTTVANWLRDEDFTYCRYSQVLKNILAQQVITPSRSALQKIGYEINRDKGQRWLGKQLCLLLKDAKCGVIDGLRFLEDHALMVETYGPAFFHLHLTSPLEMREIRVKLRNQEDISFQTASQNPVEKKITKLEKVSNYHLHNDQTLEDLRSNRMLQKLLRVKCQ